MYVHLETGRVHDIGEQRIDQDAFDKQPVGEAEGNLFKWEGTDVFYMKR